MSGYYSVGWVVWFRVDFCCLTLASLRQYACIIADMMKYID